MKYRNIAFLSVFFLLFGNYSYLTSQNNPKLYLHFVTHNEENDVFLNNYSYYILNRNNIIQLANVVVSKNVKWNFQSDHAYLRAVIKYDTGSTTNNTNGKNIIRWLVEDMGITCDPHAHETSYNYADVAHLHDSLGITATKVVGGFLYDTIVNGNNWENLEAGIYGRQYPWAFWKPDILWGGGTQNHVNDPQVYGAFKPKSMAEYWVHDPARRLTLIGNGCGNKIWDTSNVSYIFGKIKRITDAIDAHTLPDSGFYTAAIFISSGSLSTTVINKFSQIVDSINALVSQNKVEWKEISAAKQIWDSVYNRQPFWIKCENLPPLGIEQISYTVPGSFALYQNYPNPFNPETIINYELRVTSYVQLKIFNVLGEEVTTLVNEELRPGTYEVTWEGSNYSSGVYYYRLSAGEYIDTKKMVLIK